MIRAQPIEKERSMNVELLYHTPDPQRAVATAARLCYAPVGAAELMETLSEERIEKVLRTILGAATSRLSSMRVIPLPSMASHAR